jgi:hypothetical protein
MENLERLSSTVLLEPAPVALYSKHMIQKKCTIQPSVGQFTLGKERESR